MERKKLITLIAVVGILACGACFVPPPRPSTPRPPAPPRSQLNLRGSKRLRVTVSSGAEPHRVDTGMLEQCVADSINRRKMYGVPTAVAGGAASPGDAVLSIVVEKESAVADAQQFANDATTWDFDVTLSAMVTRADNAIEWNQTSRVYQGVVLTAKDGDPWQEGSIAARARSYICDPLAVQMLVGGG